MGRKRQTLETLLDRATKDSNGCLLWNKIKDKDGYGISSIGGRKMPAHRAVFSFLGDVSGKYVLHKCNVTSCINPEHLYLGTQKDNIADQIAAGTNVAVNRTSAKVTLDQVKYIRASDKDAKSLAIELNVSYHCIWDILKFRSWNNV